MLKASDTPIGDVLPCFTRYGVDVALLIPTPTGMSKSIMDATAPLRSFLKRNNLHDYDKQQQGPQHKESIHTVLVYPDHTIETKASVYRPKTKQGDPRIWLYKLREFCEPYNLLAIAASQDTLFVFNLSDPKTRESLAEAETGLAWEIVCNLAHQSQSIANELLRKLAQVHRLGFVPSKSHGDTAVVMTLEHLLGIPPNSSKAPYYKGIELKAGRKGKGDKARNRTSLFSQTPDWENSRIKTAQALLDAYGYYKTDEATGITRRQLYCTVSAEKPNSQGLYFCVDSDAGILNNKAIAKDGSSDDVVSWKLDVLRARLASKHRETFFVTASSELVDSREYFRYDSVTHAKSPNLGLLDHLLEAGIITMDYTLSQLPNRVRDHGYLFKISPNDLQLLFPEPQHYDLAAPSVVLQRSIVRR